MRLLKVFFAFILLTSCNDNVEYSEYVSIPSGWDKTKPILFQLEQMDTINKKNLFVMIRNDEKYQFSNLFIITRLEQPNNEAIVDTLQYEMATPEGEWLGYGFSAIKESKLWYKENFKFPQKGKYTIKIEQAMRKIGENEGIELLDGITEVGLRIETAK